MTTTSPDELAQDPVWIFLDETQRDLPAAPDGSARKLTAVAGIAISSQEREGVERAIVDLHSEILATPRFWYDENAERKEKFRNGFHATEANETIKQYIHDRFLGLPFRIHLAHSRHDANDDKLVRFALLYNSILRKLIRRYSGRTVYLIFEQHTDLNSHFETVVKSACLISEDSRPIVRLGGEGVRQGENNHEQRIVVARGNKATPGCALADMMLYVFGNAVLSGFLEPAAADPAKAYIVRRWTNELESKLAYEYDYDRDEHHSGRGARRRVSSF